MDIKKILSQQIKVEQLDQEKIYALLEVSPRENMGDLSLPCFSFAKDLHKSPIEIAQSIVKEIKNNKYVADVQVLNGYVNFYLNKEVFINGILTEVDENLDNYGKNNYGKEKLACIEYSSINVAKNPHVGHLSSTVFGECYARLHQNFGYTVKRLNYLGDYGTQFGKMITAYQKWGDKKEVEKEGVDALQKLYIKANIECDKDEAFLDECRQTFLKLEKGDKEIKALFEWFVKLSIDEAKQIYSKLGIDFDDWRGEAYYAQFNNETIELLKRKGLAHEDKGALIVDLKSYDLGVAIVEQTSGASLYATRDISALLKRYDEYKYDKFVYVTAIQQKQYFKQLFKIGELLGCDFMDKVHHTTYGMISVPEGKISSRKGAVALIKDLFNASIKKAKEVLIDKGTISEDMDKLSQEIGVSALVFDALRTTSSKDSVFDLQSAINFDGETGPYLQYTYARCCSILRNWKNSDANLTEKQCSNLQNSSAIEKQDFNSKNSATEKQCCGSQEVIFTEQQKCGDKKFANIEFKLLGESAWNIVKLIQKFPSVLEGAFNDYEPCYIARFAIDLAGEFNKYYNENRIITEDILLTETRVEFTKIIKTILGKCLYFLVMSAPEKM